MLGGLVHFQLQDLGQAIEEFSFVKLRGALIAAHRIGNMSRVAGSMYKTPSPRMRLVLRLLVSKRQAVACMVTHNSFSSLNVKQIHDFHACAGGFNLGYVNGGPVVMVYGWIFVCLFSMTVALSLAEICSAYPTAVGDFVPCSLHYRQFSAV